MGTNFYWHEKPPCECCGQEVVEPIHIGKSSGGWCFSLHISPQDGITTLGDWIERFERPGSYIKNEYGDTVSVDGMLKTIRERGWDRRGSWFSPFYSSEAAFMSANHAAHGPRGLLRHQIGPHCAGHGDGTWDYIEGSFS